MYESLIRVKWFRVYVHLLKINSQRNRNSELCEKFEAFFTNNVTHEEHFWQCTSRVLGVQTHHHTKAGALQIPNASPVGTSGCCFRLNGSPEGICNALYHLRRGTGSRIGQWWCHCGGAPTHQISAFKLHGNLQEELWKKSLSGIRELLCLTITKLTSYANKQISRTKFCFFSCRGKKKHLP